MNSTICPCCHSTNVSRTYEELIESSETTKIEEGGIGYICNQCECLFTVLPDSDKTSQIRRSPVSDDIIQEEKLKYAANIRAQVSYVGFIVLGLITAGLLAYCWISDFTYQEYHEGNWLIRSGYHTAYNYEWLLIALLFVIFLFCTLRKWNKIIAKKQKAIEYEKMSNYYFKRLHPELFTEISLDDLH